MAEDITVDTAVDMTVDMVENMMEDMTVRWELVEVMVEVKEI
jgi:hypothetical protein